jgi:hypothetical protein
VWAASIAVNRELAEVGLPYRLQLRVDLKQGSRPDRRRYVGLV